MPVSPADFEFYSRMTGQPIPNTPAGRMAIAPQVYNMRRSGGGFGRVLRGAAKGALAAGALAGAGALALATQEEMAKTKAPQAEKPKDSVDLDADIPKTVKASALRDEADRLSASVLGTSRGSAMSAPDLTGYSQSQPVVDDRQYLLRGSDDDRIGAPLTADKAKQVEELRQRYSGQTVVPQADPNTALESRGAQIASTSKPTQPRVEVRQQPSSGAQVTDLSNVAATESAASTVREKTSDFIGRVFGTVEQAPSQLAPYGALNPQEQEIRDLMTAYESLEGQALAGQDQSISPFQVGGAMLSLREQNQPVREMQKSMPGASNEEIVSAMNAPAGSGGVRMQLPSTSGKPASVEFFPEARGEGGISAAKVQYKPGGKTYTFEASPEGLARLQGIQSGAEKVKSGKTFLTDAVSKGQLANPVDTFFAALKSESAPVQTDAPEKQSPPELEKQMVSDAGKGVVGAVLGLMGAKKINPREEQIRRDVDRTLGRFTPEQKETEVRRRLGQ
tara:strand:- start:1156 stop:2673 length:1518 start_codon:yes stop_codon:yes gene_type:complete